MRVPDDIRKVTCFVGCRENGEARFGGTAVFIQASPNVDADKRWQIVLTAGHIIERIRRASDDGTVLLSVNHVTRGVEILESSVDEWYVDEAHPEYDVALLPAPADMHEFDHLWTNPDAFATQEVIDRWHIGVGDELLVPGLFHRHRGSNLPVVRLGSVASMPEQLVQTEIGDIPAYLAELRSMGGVSGSPVYAYMPPLRVDFEADYEDEENLPESPDQTFYFLGLIAAHFDQKLSRDVADALWLTTEVINMGIAVVVPAKCVLEVIEGWVPKFLASEHESFVQGLPQAQQVERGLN